MRYLRDLGLVQTFLIDYTAQINAKDINFLASATMNKAADGFVEAATAMGRGYGHVFTGGTRINPVKAQEQHGGPDSGRDNS
jgi:hypothetical protein